MHDDAPRATMPVDGSSGTDGPVSMSMLFRREAVRAQRRRLLGEVVITQPLTFAALSGFLCAIVAVGLAFLSTASYARRETVSGVIVPAGGIVTVTAPRSAVVSRVHVAEGATVAAGAALVTLADARVTGNGLALDEAMLTSLRDQADEIEAQKGIEKARLRRETDRLEALIADLGRERSGLEAQLDAQSRRVASAARQHRRSNELAAAGYVSDQDVAAAEQEWLALRQASAALQERLAATDGRIRQAGLELARLPLDLAARLSGLASTAAGIRIRRLELEGRGSVRVTAPVAGRVAALQAVQGTTVDGGTALLMILPADSALEAQLWVPSSAIGFVVPGQPVHLLYDAFDYRRFGVHRGVIAETSAAAMPQQAGREPVFRARVRLERATVRVGDRELPLQPGMTLRADIVLERQPVLRWWLAPLLGLKGRS